MASNRYGIITHSRVRDCKLRFPSVQARTEFQKEFEAYHASHDHDGEPPQLTFVTASEIGANTSIHIHNIEDVTIDGYAAHEIYEYHEDRDRAYVSYKPPTCCVAPILAKSNGTGEFMPSDAFERHALSAIFSNMPDADYQSLLSSVEQDGFIEPIIRIYEGKILDGWHRYRAAQELNLIRKLRFQKWNADRDGDPKAFVLARNLERRHLTPGQRGQIAVSFNERFGHGGDRSNVPNGTLKTRKELAEQVNVGERTISRAVQVEQVGGADAVISGEKTAGEIISEVKQRRADCRRELVGILKTEGVLNVETANMHELAEKHHLKPADVQKLRETVWDTEVVKARARWQKAYTKSRMAWMDNAALSTSVEWEAFTAVAIEQTDMSFLSTETFTQGESRIKSCTDYKLLQHEADNLITLAVHIRNPSMWVSELIPQSVRDEYECKALGEKIDARLPKWKERLPVQNQDVPVGNFTKDLLITVFRECSVERQKNSNFMTFEVGEPGTPLSVRELDELRCAIQNETYWLIYAVRKALLGETEKLPLQEALDEMKADEEDARKQAKIDHNNARLAVNSAFFDTNLHNRMTDFEVTNTGGKLEKFYATVVAIKTPKLRFNIFTPDEFFFDTRGDVERDFSDQFPDMYRGRDLTTSEIRDEIEVLRSIAKDIRWYMENDEHVLGWVEQVVAAITPKLDDVRKAFLEARDALRAAIAETGISEIDFLDAASNQFMGSKRNRPYRTCMKPVAHFDGWSVFNFTSWTADIKALHADLENNADWIQQLSENGEFSAIDPDSTHDTETEIEVEIDGKTHKTREEHIATQIQQYKAVGLYKGATEEKLREYAIKRISGTSEETKPERDTIHEKQCLLDNARGEDDLEAKRQELWDAFHKRIPKWREKYAESGYKENDLIQRATQDDVFDALRRYQDREPFEDHNLPAADIKEATRLMQQQNYIFARNVREIVRQRIESPENQIHYISITYGKDPTALVMFNSEERLTDTESDRLGAKRAISELPPQLRDALLRYAQKGETREMEENA